MAGKHGHIDVHDSDPAAESPEPGSTVDGEVSGRDEAVARAERIRGGIESLGALQDDIAAAYHRRDWAALGYGSWEEYVSGEFGENRLQLSRQQRQEIVASLRGEGLSTRAIGVALGVSHSTARRDLPGGTNVPPGPVLGTDGRSYPAPSAAPVPTPPRTPDAPPAPPPDPPSASSPAVARRRPITEQATDAGWDVRKAVERVGRILADDRYAHNADQVALSLRGHLLFARDQITAALIQFGD